MSRILITGGAGFIGSHFADQLLQADHEVIIVDDLRHSTTAFVDRRAHLIELDYASDQGLAAIGQLGPEFIFHVAAQIDVRISCEDPIRDAQENIISTLKLIESGLHAGMKYFCFASSGGAIYHGGVCYSGSRHTRYPGSCLRSSGYCDKRYGFLNFSLS